MAKTFGSGGRHGGGGDRDNDGRPGNSSESAAYSRKYDPRGDGESGSRIDADDRVRMALSQADAKQAADAEQAAREAQGQVHFFPSVGKFYTPKDENGTVINSWAAHAELVKDERTSLAFNPEKYVYFDKIIDEKLNNPALSDPDHPDYAKYEGLRTNIAVLRNDIIGMYLKDGAFNPGDEQYVPLIAGIATTIGNALANDAFWKRPFTRSLSVEVANVEGVGAAKMYETVLAAQNPPGFFSALRRNVMMLLGMGDRDWGLPPIAETPFSDTNLAAPPPAAKQCFTDAELAAGAGAAASKTASVRETDDDRLLAFSENAVRSAKKAQSVTELTTDAREKSIEEARIILRWLKNLQFNEQPLEEFLNHGTPSEQLAKLEAVSKLVTLYEGQLEQAIKTNPALAYEAAVQDANDAAGGAALALAAHAAATGGARATDLTKLAEGLSPASHLSEEEPVSRLLASLETGLSTVSGSWLNEKSPVERLAEISRTIQATAQRLRSVETLEAEPREESLELAREILRRLKNLSFSDKPIHEMIDTGRPEDKVVLAQKIADMADMYRNLLSEAALANPDIVNNEQVKQATEAVETFAHTVKHMAAREIPLTQSAADSITAADSAAAVAKHGGESMKRLAGRVEDGIEEVEKALEQQQERDEDIAQEIIDSQQNLHSKKRKKRRKPRSGAGGKKQAKAAQDLTSDDYVLKQGRFAVDSKAARADSPKPDLPASMAGMKAEDIDMLKKLGSNLLAVGDQLKNISLSSNDKITPDDKNAAQRHADREQQNRGQGPRVS